MTEKRCWMEVPRAVVGLLLVAILLLVSAVSRGEYSVGDCIRLKAYSDRGVPLHPGAGDDRYSRLPSGIIAEIIGKDPNTGWVNVRAGDKSGWITTKYIEEVVPCVGGAPPSNVTYVVGTWNLEWLKDGKDRGFPEDRWGGPSYEERTLEDYDRIAALIESIDFKILLLQEINGERREVDGEEEHASVELDRLVGILGHANYDYIIGSSGRSQRIAIFYDKRYVQLNCHGEMNFPTEVIQGKQVFYRQPLFAHFTFLYQGQPMNDLVVVGVHLASGQAKARNHDRAMQKIVEKIREARDDEWCIPQGENDILIGGDFNANRWDDHNEVFWDELERTGWDVLADDPSTYSPTRLSGKPSDYQLKFRNSRIDYIIATKGNKGLAGEEIMANQALVHRNLAENNPDNFRCHASDHVPVTVQVKVMQDND